MVSKYLRDIRESVIEDRLSSVKYLIPVMSPKGGVGKTTIASLIAGSLVSMGFKVGMLDLDVTNPTTHVVLGVDVTKLLPKEVKGIEPPTVCGGIKFMTLAYFTKDSPVPLRGAEIDSVIKELLAITIWGDLDFLIIDTPPGISDEALDVIKYFRRGSRVVVVTTPSKLSVKPTEALINVLNESRVPILGVIENMSRGPSYVKSLCNRYGVNYLGSVPYDISIEECIGDLSRLLSTRAGKVVNELVSKVISEVLSRVG